LVTVYVKDRESLDEAIRRFNKLIEKEGITAKAKEIMYYTKPSKARREKMNKLRRKLEKKKRKEQSKKHR
jgi:small subunit ribosomal protein S21